MHPSKTELFEIFYSGQFQHTGDKTQIIKLHFLLQKGYLEFEMCNIASKDEYIKLSSDTDALKLTPEADGGGQNHIALKLLSSQYLKRRGFLAKFEQPFCGYYPDVLTNDHTIAIECGHTSNVDKIFTYYKQGNLTELIQVPYPSSEDLVVNGYKFIAQPSLNSFLEFEQKETLNNIRDIIKNL